MSPLTLIIGNKAYSSWSLRPWLVLKHFQIPFTEIRVPLYTPGAGETIRKHSPSGKVPALTDGPIAVWDSLAICEFLAENFPEKHLWPRQREARAEARAVSAEMHSGFGTLREKMPMNCRAVGRKVGRDETVSKDVARIQGIWRECREKHDHAGPWLFGEFSIADAMYAPVVFRFQTYGVACDAECRAYMDTALEHPAIREWVADAKQEPEVIERSEVGLT